MRRLEELIRLKFTAVRLIDEGKTSSEIWERTGLDWKVIKRLRDTHEKTKIENKGLK